jgi:hypothetical protein
MRRRFIALAAAMALAVLGVTAWIAGGADATTLTCTNIAHAVTTPIGCGGAQSATTAHGTLDMAVIGTANASGNYFNSPVGVKTESLSATREDFTVFALGGSITGGLGGLGSYVVMYTPNGHINSWTHVSGPVGVSQPAPGEHFNAGFSDFCVSVTQIPNGPHGALRWNAILRNCSSNGVFTMGDNAAVSPVENAVTFSFANRWQLWAPTLDANGLEFVNVSLHNKFNVPYVLDIKGSGSDGSALLAFPSHNGLNEQWTLIGCTHPADLLNVGSYQFCP